MLTERWRAKLNQLLPNGGRSQISRSILVLVSVACVLNTAQILEFNTILVLHVGRELLGHEGLDIVFASIGASRSNAVRMVLLWYMEHDIWP